MWRCASVEVVNALLIRTAGQDDLEAVLAIHAAHGSRESGPPSPSERKTWERMLSTGDLIVYLADVGGVSVGTATIMDMPNVTYGCAPTMFIEAVVVSPSWRRQGVATAILTLALADARRRGCHKVQLLSHKRHRTGAHQLYERMGFEAEAEGFRLYL